MSANYDQTFAEDYMPFLGNPTRTLADLSALDAMMPEQREAKRARMDDIMDKAATMMFERYGPLRTKPNPFWINRE